jgi:hypothetical protein
MVPPPLKLRREWTSNKLGSLVRSRNIDFGRKLIQNIIFTCNPKPINEIITEVNINALNRGYTHSFGSRPHRSTVGVKNGIIMEQRYYFNSGHIEWIPIFGL